MKTIVFGLLATLVGITSALADLPKLIAVGTEEVSSSKFKPWKEADPAAYSGRFTGDIAGDTAGRLEIKIKKSGEEYVPFSASGVYREEPAGPKPTVVEFTNGYFSMESHPVVHVGPFQIFFVSYDAKKGVVVGSAFIPKE